MSAAMPLPPETAPSATSLDRRIRMLRTAMGPLIAAALLSNRDRCWVTL